MITGEMPAFDAMLDIIEEMNGLASEIDTLLLERRKYFDNRTAETGTPEVSGII